MLIEIHGAGFANKGAQLMLETVVHKLRSINPKTRCAIAAGGDRPFQKVFSLGIEMIWPSGAYYGTGAAKRAIRNAISRWAPESMLKPYGLVTRNQIDALIDISGYSFGDLWGVGSCKTIQPLVSFYRGEKKPVVMLPQMLGPFENSAVAREFSQFANQCDLIYARDEVSFEAANQVVSTGNVKLAPDITIDSVRVANHGQNPDLNRVCLVPNVRMTDKGKDPWRESDYFEFFRKCAEKNLKAGKTISIVVHEDKGADSRMAEEIEKQINSQNCSVFSDPDPKILKSHIGSSRYVVGSRFHSLVAALSSSVPVISLGWAHKYEQLLSDYNQTGFAFREKRYNDCCESLLSELNNDEELTKHKQVLAAKNKEFRIRLDELWKDVAKRLCIEPTA